MAEGCCQGWKAEENDEESIVTTSATQYVDQQSRKQLIREKENLERKKRHYSREGIIKPCVVRGRHDKRSTVRTRLTCGPLGSCDIGPFKHQKRDSLIRVV